MHVNEPGHYAVIKTACGNASCPGDELVSENVTKFTITQNWAMAYMYHMCTNDNECTPDCFFLLSSPNFKNSLENKKTHLTVFVVLLNLYEKVRSPLVCFFHPLGTQMTLWSNTIINNINPMQHMHPRLSQYMYMIHSYNKTDATSMGKFPRK